MHELIDSEDGLGAVTSIAECYVAGVGGTAATAVVHVVCVDDYLLDFAVLAK